MGEAAGMLEIVADNDEGSANMRAAVLRVKAGTRSRSFTLRRLRRQFARRRAAAHHDP
jgi:hypothetical protein